MPTKRVPLSRTGRRPIPDEAVEAFEMLMRTRSDEGWWDAHDQLLKLLQPHRRIPPWQFPILILPAQDDGRQAWDQQRELFRELDALRRRRHG